MSDNLNEKAQVCFCSQNHKDLRGYVVRHTPSFLFVFPSCSVGALLLFRSFSLYPMHCRFSMRCGPISLRTHTNFQSASRFFAIACPSKRFRSWHRGSLTKMGTGGPSPISAHDSFFFLYGLKNSIMFASGNELNDNVFTRLVIWGWHTIAYIDVAG